MTVRLPTEARQLAIVAAAIELARDASPGAITTAEIAGAVGLTQGALFRHFESKDAIWVAALQWVQVELIGALHVAARAAATPVEALGAVFRAHVEFVVAHPGVPRLIFHELQRPSDSPVKVEVRGVLQAYRSLLMNLLGAGVEAQQLPADLDRESAATVFVGMVQGLVMQSMLTGRLGGLRAQGERVFALYLRGIGAGS